MIVLALFFVIMAIICLLPIITGLTDLWFWSVTGESLTHLYYHELRVWSMFLFVIVAAFFIAIAFDCAERYSTNKKLERFRNGDNTTDKETTTSTTNRPNTITDE